MIEFSVLKNELISKIRNYTYKIIKKFRLFSLFKRFTRIGKMNAEFLIFKQENFYYAVPAGHNELLESLLFFNTETKDLSLMQTFAKKRKFGTFLDIGANIGEFTYGMANCASEIVAVEGNALLSKCLALSNILNGEKVTILNKWVVPKIEASFSQELTDNLLTTSLKRAENDQNIEVSSLVRLSELLETYKPLIVKIDIEGLDIDVVLSSTLKSLRSTNYLMIEVLSHSENLDRLIEHLKLAGLKLTNAVSIMGFELNTSDFMKLKSEANSLFNLHFTRENPID